MALGSLVLGGITFAPVLAVGGLAVAAEGEKAMTKATEFECEVRKAVAEMELRESVLGGVLQRLSELSDLLQTLRGYSEKQLKPLESLASGNLFKATQDEHMEALRALLLTVSSIAQIMRTPVLSEDGNLNPEIDIVIKTVSVRNESH